METSRKYVSYYRVSTAKQGASGLGLEAQQEAVRSYLERQPNSKLVDQFTEVESGKKNDRPQLQAALERCGVYNATLIIAKLDRLARNVHFISTLMEKKVDFVAVDFPEANRLTIHILAAVAEHEAEMISARTTAGLAAAKARGTKLGGDRAGIIASQSPAGRAASLKTRRKRAAKKATGLLPMLRRLQDQGKSLRAIADHLNVEGVSTPRGTGQWSAVQVSRLLKLETR